MYNSNRGTLPYLDRDNVPSLVVATTSDMEFAHFDGYEGKTIPCKETAPFSAWSKQIEDMEMATALNPLRIFPLFSYDPRRYRLPDAKSPGDKRACENWDKPFSYIVGCGGSGDCTKIWLGFYMNPALGFRPFDEYCEHLPEFYKECEKNKVPILVRCVAAGIIPGDVERYNNFDNGHREERKKNSEERHGKMSNAGVPNPLCSDMYCGKDRILEDSNLDQYYRNYSHPRNWIPVLKYFPDLRLCFSGFGGNPAWQYMAEREWTTENEMPGKDWISSIITLTRYKNVYADISGLDINNPFVRIALVNVLNLVLNDDVDFKHLKYKLIFGSDWYLTHLMNLNVMDYNGYCTAFKRFFDTVDESGELWERVSLLNPWNFYALGDKIDDMHGELGKIDGVDKEMLKKMKDVFDGSEGGDGLVKYVSGRNEKDPPKDAEIPGDDDEDLAAFEAEVLEASQVTKTYWSYGEGHTQLRNRVKDEDNVWISKYDDDLNFHVETKDGNDGKIAEFTLKNNNGKEIDLRGTVYGSRVVFEKVFKNYEQN
jgi:hypothetical protein